MVPFHPLFLSELLTVGVVGWSPMCRLSQPTILSCISWLYSLSRNCVPAVVVPHADNSRKPCQPDYFLILKTSGFFFSMSFYLKIYHSENTGTTAIHVSGHGQSHAAEIALIVGVISPVVPCSLSAARGYRLRSWVAGIQPVSAPQCARWQLTPASATAVPIGPPDSARS